MKFAIIAVLALAGCVTEAPSEGAAEPVVEMNVPDEAPPMKDLATITWVLTHADDKQVTYDATLVFDAEDRISGQAPCNEYFSSLTRNETSVAIGAIAATKMACPRLAEETVYFNALSGVSMVSMSTTEVVLEGNGHKLRYLASE